MVIRRIDRKKMAEEIRVSVSCSHLFDLAKKNIEEYLKRHGIQYMAHEYFNALENAMPRIKEELLVAFNKDVAISSIAEYIILRRELRRELKKDTRNLKKKEK